MYICIVCGKVKSLTANKALFAVIDKYVDSDNSEKTVCICHGCNKR